VTGPRSTIHRFMTHFLARPFVIGAVIAFVAPGAAHAAPTWQSLAPVPSIGAGVEGMAVAAASSNLIVAAYGLDNGPFNDTNTTRLYNIATNTWSFGSPAPLPVRSELGSLSKGAFVYALGGRLFSTGTAIADVARYHAPTNTWQTLAPMPTARAAVAVAETGGGIFAIGGRSAGGGPCSGGELTTVERYDLSTGTWSPKAALPSARSDAAAAAVGNKIYLFGGCTSLPVRILDEVDVYDISTNTWSTAPADLPTAAAAFYTVGRVLTFGGGRIYVVGGTNGSAPLGTTQIYNTRTNSWTSGPAMITPRAEMGVVAVGTKVYAVGGAKPALGSSSNANEVLNP
jgi:Kelch motif protein